MKKFLWQGHTFWLHPHRLMFWEEENMLIGSDLHLGKVGHFRKAGIALPQQVHKEDLHRLFTAIQYFQPKRFLIVGDLFHSGVNKELDWFLRWRADLSSLDFTLIRGNHDLLSNEWYQEKGIQVCPNYISGGLRFLHDPIPSKSIVAGCLAEPQTDVKATISGHIHPGIRINGFARQSVQLPCFHFSSQQCVLPAFGQFTGLYPVQRQPGDEVFAVLSNEVVKL